MWTVVMSPMGDVTIQHGYSDFLLDAVIDITGSFRSTGQKVTCARILASELNKAEKEHQLKPDNLEESASEVVNNIPWCKAITDIGFQIGH